MPRRCVGRAGACRPATTRSPATGPAPRRRRSRRVPTSPCQSDSTGETARDRPLSMSTTCSRPPATKATRLPGGIDPRIDDRAVDRQLAGGAGSPTSVRKSRPERANATRAEPAVDGVADDPSGRLAGALASGAFLRTELLVAPRQGVWPGRPARPHRLPQSTARAGRSRSVPDAERTKSTVAPSSETLERAGSAKAEPQGAGVLAGEGVLGGSGHSPIIQQGTTAALGSGACR